MRLKTFDEKCKNEINNYFDGARWTKCVWKRQDSRTGPRNKFY